MPGTRPANLPARCGPARRQAPGPAADGRAARRACGPDYAYNNPVTGSDPTGLYLPNEGGTCEYNEVGCQSAADSNPPLNLTDLGEGAIDALYNTAIGILSLAAHGQGNIQAGMQISSMPAPFADSNPGNPSFRVGYGGT